MTKQCSWRPRLHWEHKVFTPCSLPRQVVQYDQLRTTTQLPMDCVVVESEAVGDCGDCCGKAAVGGFNENSKPLWGLEFFTTRSISTCYTVEGHLRFDVAEYGSGSSEFLPVGRRFLLAHPPHTTKNARTKSNLPP